MPDPVPRSAVVELLAGLPTARGGAPLSPDPASLLDPTVASREARRFKVDASFALRRDGRPSARFSINDKGEERAFRDRLRAAAPALDLPPRLLEGFLKHSPPGHVQTTLAVKWASAAEPDRVGLYFEELLRAPDGADLIGAITRFGLGIEPPPAPGGFDPVAVCLDLTAGEVVGAKDYWMGTERVGEPLLPVPPSLSALRDAFPFDPERETRRFLLARRLDEAGAAGSKLMWMSEAHGVDAAQRAWGVVEERRRSLRLPPCAPAEALDLLRDRAFARPECFFYPDLVSVNVDAEGEVEALVVYVSVK